MFRHGMATCEGRHWKAMVCSAWAEDDCIALAGRGWMIVGREVAKVAEERKDRSGTHKARKCEVVVLAVSLLLHACNMHALQQLYVGHMYLKAVMRWHAPPPACEAELPPPSPCPLATGKQSCPHPASSFSPSASFPPPHPRPPHCLGDHP